MIDSLHDRRVAYLLAAVSAVLSFIAFCGFDQFYLFWFSLVPFLWAIDDETLSGREVVALSWFWGTLAYLGGYTWIAGMLQDFGRLPLPVAALGLLLLCLGQAVLFALWGWGVHRVTHRYGAPMVWAAPTVLVLCEWAVPALFPTWLSNSQYKWILFIQSADIWGMLGLTWIMLLGNAVIYETIAWRFRGNRRFPAVAWVIFAVVMIGNLGYGLGSVASIDDTVAHTDRTVRIGMVQVNMGIYEKDEKRDEGVRRHREQSLELERQGVDLIVWPESGYNKWIRAGTQNVAGPVLGPITTPLLFGGLRYVKGRSRQDPDREVYNSAFLVDGDGQVLGTYDKTHLLMFGEYVPFGEAFPWLYDLFPHTSRFAPGKHTDPLVLDGIRYGTMICYEDIQPRFVRKMMEHEPHILVNITNDAWFGRSREPTIHLALAIFRAVEYRRFLVRATNTGISAFVDPAGRILQQTPVFARANLVDEVAPLEGRTIYARLGDWFAIPCLLVLLWWIREPLRGLGRRIVRPGRHRRTGKKKA